MAETVKETCEAVPATAPENNTTVQGTGRRRGRPLSFDRDTALDVAMRVFWELGYDATSVSRLTEAMQITAPSLYTAFGDKEQLFLSAIERYSTTFGRVSTFTAMHSGISARTTIEEWLLSAAGELAREGHPKGCMFVLAAMNSTVPRVQETLRDSRKRLLAGLETCIQRAVDCGEIPATTNAQLLAQFFVTVLQGLSMQARVGATRQALESTARTAMQTWPASS